jgi:hypothetical protein
LERGYRVNNLKNWLAANIHNINDNREVKVVVILKGKLKSVRGLLVHLAVIAVLYKILNCLNLNFMTYLLKNFKQLVNK